MIPLAAILASGALVAVVAVGFALGRVLGYRRPADALALATPLGVAAVSVPLALGAVLGVFRAATLGAVGWLAAIVILGRLARRSARADPAHGPRASVRVAWPLVTLLALAAVLYLGFPAESPLGNRDEGIYSLGGLALDRAGTLVVPRPEGLARAPALFAPYFQGLDFHLPGIPAARVLKPQFPPILPAWIAQLHAIGGDVLLYRINALFALGAIGVFHRLARRLARPPVALLASAMFALNPAQVWIARVNLAEPLGQLLALGAILLAIDALRTRSDRRALAAGALFALACAVRLDLAIASPLLFAAACVTALWGRGSGAEAAQTTMRLAVATLAGQALAVAAVALWTPAYVADHVLALSAALIASALFALAYRLARRGAFGWAQRSPTRERLGLACVAALCGGFVYAAFVRPHVGSFALIPGRSAIAGLRDYREESLRDLAAYLGWPTLWLALAGMAITIVRLVRGTGAHAAVLLALAVGTATVFITSPQVSPDHFWAIRRFVTLAIPLGVLMAAWSIQCAVQATRGWRYRYAIPIVTLAAIAATLTAQRHTLRVRENAGLTAQLRALDATLPDGRVIVRDFDALAATLALGFGREVLPLRDEHVPVDAAAQGFWRDCATRRCTLVHASFDGLQGLRLAPTWVATLGELRIAPTYAPLPRTVARDATDVLVTPVLGLASGTPPRNAGAARDWRLAERGLHRDESAGGNVARWTDGSAALTLAPWRADALEVRLALAPGGARDVRIDVDGVPKFDGSLAAGEHTLKFALPSDAATPRRLAIRSEAFVPTALGLNADRRTLGVSVRAVRLLDDTAALLTPEAPPGAFRSAIDVPGGAALLPRLAQRHLAAPALTIDVANRGVAVWPALGDVREGAACVALGILWTRAGRPERLLEQRVQLPYSLRPDERLRIGVPLDARSLPDGEYEVAIGLVYEGVAWFAERGDRMLRFPVKVGQ